MKSQVRDRVRLGLIGLGNMGAFHARLLLDGRVARAELAAVCDCEPERLAVWSEVPQFGDAKDLFESGLVDAVVIATPHTSHVPLAVNALDHGLHVLVEKPIGVRISEVRELVAKHDASGLIGGMVFNQRTDPGFRKIRDLVQGGELGEIQRVHWTVTDWYRTDSYYHSSPWRATWAGEGGGVLINQSVHNLDLLQWIFGRPVAVRADCACGRYHDVEVEDEVVATFTLVNGARAGFISSSGEAPGVNRLEIAGDRGLVTLEEGRLIFLRNEVPSSVHCRVSDSSYQKPPTWRVEIPLGSDHGRQHEGIVENFIDAILDGAELIAPLAEGMVSLEMINAMLLSSAQERKVAFPIDAAAYDELLDERIAQSGFRQPTRRLAGEPEHHFGPASAPSR